MNSPDASSIQSLFKKYGITPSKRLGQNFLIDNKILDKIIEASKLDKNDLVIEIGPGTGNLTKKLANSAGFVIAVEKDFQMVKILKDVLVKFKNVEIIEGDILKINLPNFFKKISANYRLQTTDYRLIANIPYYLTSSIIRQFLEEKIKPKEMMLLVQKEVAERIAAQKGDTSFISILAQFYGKPKIIDFAPKESFWPIPKVDSAIIKISNIKKPDGFKPEDIKNFFRLVKMGFSSRRKTLANNLAAGLKIPRNKIIEILESADLPPKTRAQELTIEQWKKLWGKLSL